VLDFRPKQAAEWGRHLLDKAAFDSRGEYLGAIEAVGTSRDGRLRRLGLRLGHGRQLHFVPAEGALFEDDRVLLPAARRLHFL
jgi:hypothetical protein